MSVARAVARAPRRAPARRHVSRPIGRGERPAGGPAPARSPGRQATLSGALVRRPTALATLLLDRVDPAAPTARGGSDAGFALWLRTVLSPDDAAAFRAWARADPTAGRVIRRRFDQAADDGDFETLLRDTRRALAAPRRR